MCFRPPTVELDENPTCPACGADIFIGATKCGKCGAAIGSGPVAAKSAPPKGAPGGSDQTFFGGAKTGSKPPSPPTMPSSPKFPKAPGSAPKCPPTQG